MGSRAVFEVRGVSKSFGENHVLRDVSLKVEQGEILGIIGSSGSGKTTLLNLLVGFLRPDRGMVTYTQYDAAGNGRAFNILLKPLVVNKSYGFAAQTPSFYEKLTVRENLEYFAQMYDLSGRAIRSNVDVLLRLMGLKASQYVMAKDLSGGMKRRLDIACAMVHNPAVLILDEPTADLDPVLRNQIWEVVRRINMRGTTVVLSSHHLNELDTLCSRIAIVKDGRLVDVDTPDKLKLKYNKEQEIMVESYPGSYAKIVPKLKGKNITGVARQGTYLTIRTEEPERIIKEVLTLLEKAGEQLLDIRLNKPNLDDVFVSIYKNGTQQPKEGLENGEGKGGAEQAANAKEKKDEGGGRR